MVRSVWKVLLVLGLVLQPGWTLAQSAISGQVTDDTGGVLPGATVEAASPALIEGSRVVVTDGTGRYTIIDLRPGIYVVTVRLPGFTTARYEAVHLPGDFTQTIDAVLEVGSIAETVTVSADSAGVDIQRGARTQVLDRETLDALPAARNPMSIGYLAQGVRLTFPEVGGSAMMSQIRMTAHGANSRHSVQQIDGMQVNSQLGNGGFMNYNNEAGNQEVAISTSSSPAEVSAGGVRVSMIPREGGNSLSGSFYAGGTDGSWQSNNITDQLREKGLQTPNRISNIHDVNVSIGGPVLRDRLWYFGSFRAASVDSLRADAPLLPDGSEPVDDQWVRSGLLRLTTQLTPRNKVSAYLDRIFKHFGREFGPGVDPVSAATRRDPDRGNYSVAQAKWTSTISSRALLEVGYSQVIERFHEGYQPGFGHTVPDDLLTCSQTPCFHSASYDQTRPWFAGASRFDFVTRQRTGGTRFGEFYSSPVDRFYPNAAFSYVTGSHNVKLGVQWSFGSRGLVGDGNAHLEQRYRNGVPEQVWAYNRPVLYNTTVKRDLGFYAQDTWTVDRLTVNAGFRVESFASRTDNAPGTTGAPAGRFVGERPFTPADVTPTWLDVAPRFSLVYDLFGDARTALKLSVNRFVSPHASTFPRRYHPQDFASDPRDWFDCHLLADGSACSGLDPYGTNGDDVAQDHEIGLPNNLASFVDRVPPARPDPGLEREYNVEYTVGVQHEVAPRVSVTAAYYRRTFYDIEGPDNVLLEPSDYISFTAVSPFDGTELTIYNLDPSKRGLRDIVDRTSSVNRDLYNGFELSLQARLPNGGTVSGGWTAQQHVRDSCDQEDPNGVLDSGFANITRRVIRGGRFCQESELGIPFRHDFKVFGVYPLPWEVEVSGVVQSYAGDLLSVIWNVPSSVFPEGQRTQQTRVPLAVPGTRYLERLNQTDISIRKIFRVRGFQYSVQVDVYNLFNSSVVTREIETFGSSLGRPQFILLGRMLRLAVQSSW